MATAPATATLKVVPASEVKAPEIKIPDIKSGRKLVVWKGADGVYHESIDSLRVAMTKEVIANMIALNDVLPSEMPEFLAVHFDRIKSAVDAAIKKLPD